MTRDEALPAEGPASKSMLQAPRIDADLPAGATRLVPALSDPAASAGQPTQPSHWRIPIVAGVIMLAGLAGFGLWSVAGQQVGAQVDPMILETESLLDQLGFPPGPIDGIADADTGAAIRSYQQAADLPVDGRATPALLDDLRAVAAAMPSRQ